MIRTFVTTLMAGAMLVQPASAAMLTAAPTAVEPARSAVMPAVGLSTDAQTAKVIQVRKWRHRHYRRHHHHRHRGAGAFGAGLAVGIVGALIAKGVSESSARSRFDRCARDFVSFDYETGTIITRSGREVLCPYLR